MSNQGLEEWSRILVVFGNERLVLVPTLLVGRFATKRASSVCASLSSWRVSIVSLGSDDVCAVVRRPVTPRIFVPALMFVFVNQRRRGFVWSDFCICYTVRIIFGRRVCGLWWNRRGLEDWFDCFTLTHTHWEREGQFSHTLDIRPAHRTLWNTNFFTFYTFGLF